jgi:transcriptional regulator of acetoin/glycerol metabolism
VLDPALLARVGAVTIALPPLRDRPDDVAALVDVTMARLGACRRWRRTALAALSGGEWPGNVRQLVNVVEAACLARPSGDIGPDDLPADELALAGIGIGSGRSLTRMEEAQRSAILAGLRDTAGNKVEAAARLGISRSTLYRKLRAYGIADGSAGRPPNR